MLDDLYLVPRYHKQQGFGFTRRCFNIRRFFIVPFLRFDLLFAE